MIRSLFLASLILTCSFSASAQSSSPTRGEVIDFVKLYVKAQNDFDATAMMDMMSRDPNATSAAMGEITRGWEAMRENANESIALNGLASMTLGVMDVEVLSPGSALVVAPFIATVGKDSTVQMKGAYTLLVKKTSGLWQVFHEHTSVDLEGLAALAGALQGQTAEALETGD